MLAKLAHYAVRTRDLEAARRFYTEALGLRVGARPPFGFPGLWLYAGEDESEHGLVHLIADDPADPALARYLGVRDAQTGAGALDHIAFAADDWPAMQARLDAKAIPYIERAVPGLGLHQVFVTDPSGIAIELNFPALSENSR